MVRANERGTGGGRKIPGERGVKDYSSHPTVPIEGKTQLKGKRMTLKQGLPERQKKKSRDDSHL